MINIDLPESVIKLSESAFNECTSIISYNVSNYNQNFSSENGILYNKDRSEIIAFPPKNSIKVFKIPTTVVRIGFNTFRECSNLISIEIPNSVKIIGDIHVQLNTSTIYFLSDFEYNYRIHTFYNCHNLNELHCRIRNIKDVFILEMFLMAVIYINVLFMYQLGQDMLIDIILYFQNSKK